MTVTLYRPRANGRPCPLWRNGWTGWKTHVVPSPMLRQVIEDTHHLLDAPINQVTGEPAWREFLAQEVAAFTSTLPTPMSSEAAYRRIYGVMSGEGRVVNINFAEAACMALGLDIDRDTNIPTLPGNMRLAVELVQLRSGARNELKIRREAHTTLRLSALILSHPHHMERLQDLAPHDCLRPYR